MDRWINKKESWTNEWMDEWTNGWIRGWMDNKAVVSPDISSVSSPEDSCLLSPAPDQNLLLIPSFLHPSFFKLCF